MTQYHIIAAPDFKRLKDVTVLDVRNDSEHREQRLVRAHDLMPLGQLNPDDYMLRHGLDRNAPVYILCRGGVRARNAAEQFIAKGYTNMHVIEGGIIACAAAGEPVVDGAAAPAPTTATSSTAIVLPAERQAQLIEGVLAICGSVLGYALSPVFFVLTLAVGVLLIHAGVTGKDVLARKLARYTPAPAAPVACSLPKTTGKSAGGCA